VDSYELVTEQECTLVVPPTVHPQIYHKLTRNPHIKVTRTPVGGMFRSISGKRLRYRLGEEDISLTLECSNLHNDDQRSLNEIEALGVPVFVYSNVPGSLQFSAPLMRGITAAPDTGTYSCTIGVNTTVYMPKGDAAHTAYLEETDVSDEAVLNNALQYSPSAVSSTLSHEMPLGRGLMIYKVAENIVQNSGFADDGTDIYNWTLDGTGADPVDRMIEDGWMGVRALQAWGSTSWESANMRSDVSSGDDVAISFGWRGDGDLLCEENSSGAWQTVTTVADGGGYYRGTFSIGVGTNFNIKFSLSTGTYAEVCAPQVIAKSGSDRKFYHPYLEGWGDRAKGHIDSCSLKYDVSVGANVYRGPSGSDSALCVSGFVQPYVRSGHICATHKLFSLYNSLTGKELELHIASAAGDLQLTLRSNSTDVAAVNVPGYGIGDTLFIAYGVGWINGSPNHFIYAAVVDDSPTVRSDLSGSGTNFYTIYDEFYIGTSHSETLGADSAFQDVNIWSGEMNDISDYVEYMARPKNLRVHKEVCGRLFYLNSNLSPVPWQRDRVSGTISCTQKEAL
jgi:hypothetical protein